MSGKSSRDGWEDAVDARVTREVRRIAARHRNWMRRYGLTPEQVHAMSLYQGHACGVCKQTKKLCVDHDHRTGRVRGLTCAYCNYRVIRRGMTPALLRGGAAYLENPPGVPGAPGHVVPARPKKRKRRKSA